MMTEIIHMSQGVFGFEPGWGCGARMAFGMPCPTPASERKGSYFFLRFASALLAHRLAIEFNAVRVVNDGVENAVGYRDIPDLFMPVSQGHLRRPNQRPPLAPAIADFQKVPPLAVFERCHRKVIQHQDVNGGEPGQQAPETTVDMRHRQFPKQFRRPLMQDGEAVATRLLRQGAS